MAITEIDESLLKKPGDFSKHDLSEENLIFPPITLCVMVGWAFQPTGLQAVDRGNMCTAHSKGRLF